MLSRWWGPVFEADRTSRARRWQGYALRALFVMPFLIGFVLNWLARRDQFEPLTVAELAQIGSSFFGALTGVVLVGVLLIAPAATAGAVCLDRSRGMLAHIFVTDLTNREIILGKLAARLGPVLALVASVVPVAAVVTLLGGINPLALATLFLVAVGLAVLGCTLALMLSVWASKPHEVLTVVYGIWFLWLLSGPVYVIFYRFMAPQPLWLEWTNPIFMLLAVIDHPGTVSLVEPGLFCLACMVIGAACTLVAVARVRAVGCRTTVSVRRVGWFERLVEWSRGNARRFLVPKLDANPVRWREWHRARPSRWSRWVWGAYAAISTGAGLWLVDALISASGMRPGRIGSQAAGTFGVLVPVGLVLLSTSVASVLAEERARGSLDVLLCTPLSTRTILWAKWRGSFRRVPWLAFWPVVVGGLCSAFFLVDGVQIAITVGVVGLILAQGAALVSLGLALATWVKKPERATGGTIAALVFMLAGWPFVAQAELWLVVPLAILLCLSLAFALARQGFPAQALALVGLAGLAGGLGLVAFLSWYDAVIRDEPAQAVLHGRGMMLGCPVVGIIFPLSNSLTRTQSFINTRELLAGVVLWVAVYGLAAGALFEATVATFDRCLGRTPVRSESRWDRLKDWGSRTPARGGRPAGRAVSFEPRPR